MENTTSNMLAIRCIDRQLKAINNIHTVIQTAEYRAILEAVINVAKDHYARRVMIAGVGKNANIASKIAETMASLGIPSFALNVSHCGHGDFGYIGHKDIIIHISRSGSTREMLEAMEHIRLIRPNVYQALIHCKEGKAKNANANVELFIGSIAEGDEFELAPTTSTTALLCTLDTIAVQASHAIGFKRLDFLKFHPDGALGAMLKNEIQEAKPVQATQPIPTPIAPPAVPKVPISTLSDVPAPAPAKDLAEATAGLSREDAAAIAALMDPSLARKVGL